MKFSLTSEQLELLLAFENSEGLNHLAETMARDPSVVSRNIQRIAEEQPVMKKVKGRWELTPLGLQVNQRTRTFLEEQKKLFSSATEPAKVPVSCADAVLIIINAQNGLLDATQEGRNNSEAEKNIVKLLNHWRSKKRKVIHVKHVSDNPTSAFYKSSAGAEFLSDVSPVDGESIIEKVKSSAFVDTNFETALAEMQTSKVILVGFTANECIDATARDATAKGFETFVVSDASATFDMRDANGKLIRADKIHRLTMLNLNAFHAKVIESTQLTSD